MSEGWKLVAIKYIKDYEALIRLQEDDLMTEEEQIEFMMKLLNYIIEDFKSEVE